MVSRPVVQAGGGGGGSGGNATTTPKASITALTLDVTDPATDRIANTATIVTSDSTFSSDANSITINYCNDLNAPIPTKLQSALTGFNATTDSGSTVDRSIASFSSLSATSILKVTNGLSVRQYSVKLNPVTPPTIAVTAATAKGIHYVMFDYVLTSQGAASDAACLTNGARNYWFAGNDATLTTPTTKTLVTANGTYPAAAFQLKATTSSRRSFVYKKTSDGTIFGAGSTGLYLYYAPVIAGVSSASTATGPSASNLSSLSTNSVSAQVNGRTATDVFVMIESLFRDNKTTIYSNPSELFMPFGSVGNQHTDGYVNGSATDDGGIANPGFTYTSSDSGINDYTVTKTEIPTSNATITISDGSSLLPASNGHIASYTLNVSGGEYYFTNIDFPTN